MHRRMVVWAAAVGLYVVRHMLPVVVRALVAGIMLMISSLVALWRGVIPSIDTMAEEWTKQVMRKLHHTRWRREIYIFFRGVAWLSLILGWVLAALVTVWLLRLIL